MESKIFFSDHLRELHIKPLPSPSALITRHLRKTHAHFYARWEAAGVQWAHVLHT